jgi:hypothetical protein
LERWADWSAILTVVGAIAGAAVGVGIGIFTGDAEFGGKSLVDHTKDLAGAAADGIANAWNGLTSWLGF